jgi:adenine-specific DNA-methyltransferase
VDEGKLSLESKDITEEKRQELLRLFPEAQTEGGKIDFDQLKRALGDTVDTGRERYGMNWPGKADCFRLIQSPSTATLLPVRGESLDFDHTDNMIIEGDNLEVLKLLQKGYQNRVKMIYIDPPYNTGTDFVYPDDFSDNLKNYLQYTGQVDNEGKHFSNNLETDGRFHSKWLNMMYPRLYLARNLLSEDGVIFISIDDGEVANLKKLCDEIFGEENDLSQLIWKKKYIGGKHAKHFVDFHEYVIVYARNRDAVPDFLMDRPDIEKGKFDLADEYLAQRGMHYTRPLKSNLGLRNTLIYSIDCPDGSTVKNQWMVAESTFFDLLRDGRIVYKLTREGKYQVYRKFYENDGDGKVKVPSLIDDVANANGKLEIKDLFNVAEGRDIPFDNPKPIDLIRYLITPTTGGGDVILDFFAGSGSTGHAVMTQNAIDQGHRKFILIQIPEPLDLWDKQQNVAAEYCDSIGKPRYLSCLTEERIRRAALKIKKDYPLIQGDQGFRVFKLAPSNFKVWDAHTNEGVQGVERQMELAVHHIMPDRSAEDLFYEILMKSEYPLTAKVESFDAAGIAVFSIEDDSLIVCAERKVTAEAILVIAKRCPSKVIFLDEAFSGNDQLKANAKMNLESAGVKRFETV